MRATEKQEKYIVPPSFLSCGVRARKPCIADGLPEICAHGFRNPWRCGFDLRTDELYCGDVGHTRVEEIDIIQ